MFSVRKAMSLQLLFVLTICSFSAVLAIDQPLNLTQFEADIYPQCGEFPMNGTVYASFQEKVVQKVASIYEEVSQKLSELKSTEKSELLQVVNAIEDIVEKNDTIEEHPVKIGLKEYQAMIVKPAQRIHAKVIHKFLKLLSVNMEFNALYVSEGQVLFESKTVWDINAIGKIHAIFDKFHKRLIDKLAIIYIGWKSESENQNESEKLAAQYNIITKIIEDIFKAFAKH